MRLKAGAIDLNEEKNADLVIARHLWQDHRLLPPQSDVRERFERVLVFFALYSSFIVPMRVAFGVAEDPFFVVLELLVDIAFLLDVLLCFRTAILTRDYELVFEPSLIAKQYVGSGWFFIDLLASLPLDYFAPNWPYRSVLQLNRVFRVTRLLKPIDIVAKLDRRVATSATWMRIFLDFRILFYCAHIVGCMWWGIGYLEYQCIERRFAQIASDAVLSGADQLAQMNTSEVFAVFGPSDELILAATSECGEGVPWVVRTETRELTSAPLLQQYVTSLYWSIATIVRNPWIAPDTQYEKIFTFGVIAFGTVAFALIIGNVNQMVRIYDEASAARRRRLASIRVFMAFHQLPASLQTKMISYAEGDWQMTAGISFDKALGQLPPVLRSRVLMFIHADLRRQCPLFEGLPRECASLLIAQLQPQLCLQGEALIEPGSLLWELFLLRRGSLSIKRAAAETGSVNKRRESDDDYAATSSLGRGGANKRRVSDDAVSLLPRRRRGAEQGAYLRVLDKPGQYVGLVHPFEQPPRAQFRVSAIKQCQLLRVTQSTLWQVLSHFRPEVQERFCEALREHYDATLAALKLPAHESPSSVMLGAAKSAFQGGDGAFRRSTAGAFALEERIELVRGSVAEGVAEGRASIAAPQTFGSVSVSALQRQADVDEASAKINEMQQALEACEKRAEALGNSAASLPTLYTSLLKVQAELSQRPHLPRLPSGVMTNGAAASSSSSGAGGGGGAFDGLFGGDGGSSTAAAAEPKNRRSQRGSIFGRGQRANKASSAEPDAQPASDSFSLANPLAA